MADRPALVFDLDGTLIDSAPDIHATANKVFAAKGLEPFSFDTVRGFIGQTFDYLDATRRRRMATELLEALVTGRVSHAAAARKMREIVARAKGGWMAATTG